MKKYFPFLVGIVMATMLVLATNGYAKGTKWILYDNFNSGVIDTNLWNKNESSAVISVEGGRAKFEHLSGKANISSWLGIKMDPETVKGIKVKVTVQSCTGDVRARVGSFIGKVDSNYVWDDLNLQPSILSPRIYGNLSANGSPPGFPFLYNLFYGEFIRPVEIIGNTFIITMTFSNDKVTYEVDDLGEIEHKLPEDLSPTDNYFKCIGTRSSNGDGPCVVYFDDVYILR